MTDPRKIAEGIEAGGGATVEQRRTLARAYLEMVRDLPHAVGRCGCEPLFVHTDDGSRWTWTDEHRAACERLRALGGGT